MLSICDFLKLTSIQVPVKIEPASTDANLSNQTSDISTEDLNLNPGAKEKKRSAPDNDDSLEAKKVCFLECFIRYHLIDSIDSKKTE